ncbi:hypothetical protein GGTG_07879 [Gaeumannomyces tritici R3-111a-1]|uniref:Elongator complex protein 5 n=1 Tax=Gaeumannomyces tritici (strain R3-111a-1) TaxID=644352 RepID=J3P2Y8_GAET3|nr:hypothetical protein GGTG_07879 [Gaeumannomyces tritici R3-111a-1]EJT74030.1 hypothetical protein GGTG_07879 [Gaeumannomyces tritici R3-111a-1]
MAPSAQAHRRSHSLLLLQKLLNLRDGASPLTLVLDSLEQAAAPLMREFTSRAKISRNRVVLVSFATLKKPRDVDVFVKARGKPLKALRSEIAAHIPDPRAAAAAADGQGRGGAPGQRALIIIDSLNALAASSPRLLAAFLSGLVTPFSSVVGVYHDDVPLALPYPSPDGGHGPEPLAVLRHLATAVVRVSSLHHAAAARRALDRSEPEPEFGLREGREGVLVGLRDDIAAAAAADRDAVVLEMEVRRRSGRAVSERFVLAPAAPATTSGLVLLSDHPLFAAPVADEAAHGAAGEAEAETTFNLGLTEKQRRDREGIVLPYFDAQTDIGGGEGGRILYEMGREDDFDDEEDEI